MSRATSEAPVNRPAVPAGYSIGDFLPYGDEGELFVVRGKVAPPDMALGALAATLDLVDWGDVADMLDEYCGVRILPWYDDDEDKPDDVYRAEIVSAWVREHVPGVAYGWARFFEPGDPECPYGEDGGVTIVTTKTLTQRVRAIFDPKAVRVTYFMEH